MKVYSWNVWCSNRNLPELYSFIENLDFDVLCLQEVTEEMLTCFKKMPLYVAYHPDRFVQKFRLFSKNEFQANYAIILSKYEIQEHGKLQFPKLLHTFRSNTFESFVKFIRQWESMSNLGAVYADIEIEGKSVRIFSMHLTLWNPKTRANEFAHLMEYLPKDKPAVVCGDFNILEYAPVKILNWFLGGSVSEAMPWYSERALFEERFAKYNLRNPLLGKITHKFSKSQLDHILVSEGVNVRKAWVVPERHGSDHQPVGAEISL